MGRLEQRLGGAQLGCNTGTASRRLGQVVPLLQHEWTPDLTPHPYPLYGHLNPPSARSAGAAPERARGRREVVNAYDDVADDVVESEAPPPRRRAPATRAGPAGGGGVPTGPTCCRMRLCIPSLTSEKNIFCGDVLGGIVMNSAANFGAKGQNLVRCSAIIVWPVLTEHVRFRPNLRRI